MVPSATPARFAISLVEVEAYPFSAPFFVQTFAKEIFKSDYESYEGLLRVVIHNRFK
jgi:hypothetical protein